MSLLQSIQLLQAYDEGKISKEFLKEELKKIPTPISGFVTWVGVGKNAKIIDTYYIK